MLVTQRLKRFVQRRGRDGGQGVLTFRTLLDSGRSDRGMGRARQPGCAAHMLAKLFLLGGSSTTPRSAFGYRRPTPKTAVIALPLIIVHANITPKPHLRVVRVVLRGG